MNEMKVLAYKKVFGRYLTDEDLSRPEHKGIIDKVSENVMSYKGLYSGETELDRDRRFEIESALEGEATELADYFRNLFPNRFQFDTSWEILFKMYQDIAVEKPASIEDAVRASNGQTVSEQASMSVEAEPSINKSKTPIKEEKEMAEETTNKLDDALNALKASGGTAPQSAGIAKPAVDDATMKAAEEAARTVLKNDRAEKIAFSRAAKVTRGIAMQPSLAKRLLPNVQASIVKDGNADTATKKWENIWKKWCEKTGRRVSDSGNVVYDNIRNDCFEAAQQVDAFISECKNDPLRKLTLAAPSESEQLKGGYVTSPDDANETPMNQREILMLIMNKTLGRLNTSCPTSQYVARKATGRVSTAGAQGSEAVSVNQDPWKGIATVFVIHKGDFVATGVDYAYDLDETAENVLTSVRIQLPGKVFYKRAVATTTEEAAEKFSAFSISAFAEAHATKLNPDLKKFEKKESGKIEGVNGRVLDLTNDDDIMASEKSFANVIATYIAANKGSVPEGSASVIANAAGLMQKTAADETAKEAASMADIEV